MYSAEVDWDAATTGELVDIAVAALGRLASRAAPDSPVVCMEYVERLGPALDQGEAALAAWTRRADEAGEPLAAKYAGTKGWLKTSLGMRTGRATERVTMARQLPRLPKVAAGMQTGELSFGYASTICDAVAHLGDDDCAKAETILLEWAGQGLTPTHVAKLGARIKDVIAEREGTETPDADAERGDRSWWKVSRSFKGGGATSGWFDPELLALVNDRLGPLTKPAGPGDVRDHAQRLADALKAVLAGEAGACWNATLVIKLDEGADRNAVGAGQGRADGSGVVLRGESARSGLAAAGRGIDDRPEPRNGQAPGPAAAPKASGRTVPDQADPEQADSDRAVSGQAVSGQAVSGQAVSGQAVSGQAVRGPAARGRAMPDQAGSGQAASDPVHDDGRFPVWPLRSARVSARLADGTPIRPEQARIIALNAGVSALVLGSDGIPLYLGRRTRFVTPGQRRALEALYETCACDECDIPARFCQLDHVHCWADGGTTDIDRLAPACGFHNRLRYTHPGWVRTSRDEQGRWRYTVRRPRPVWARTRSDGDAAAAEQARGP